MNAALNGPEAIEDADFIDVEGENITELQNDVDSQLAKIFQEFGGDPNDTEFRIDIRRIMAGRGEQEHCFSCTPLELPVVEKVRLEYGPGQYEVWVYKNGRIFKRRKLNIAKPQVNQPHQLHQKPDDIKGIMAGMVEMQARQFEQLQAVMARPAPAPVDPMQQFQTMAAMMTAMKDLMGPQSPQVNPMEQVRASMDLAKEFAEMSGATPERGPGDALYKLVETALPALIEGGKSKVENPPQNPAQNNSQVSPQKPDDKKMIFEMMIKNKIKELTNLAAKEKDPALYAEVLLDQVPDAYLTRLVGFLNNPNYFVDLVKVDPNASPYQLWFENLKKEILELLTDEDESILTTEDKPVNTSDNVPDTTKLENQNNCDPASDSTGGSGD